MKASLYLAAIPLLATIGMAQNQPPGNPPQTQPAPTTNKTETKTSTTATSTIIKPQPAEMKTQNYSGVLVDASCSGGAPAAAASTEANRSTTDAGTCNISSNTSKFALKLKDGRVVKFDDVGNQRAQEAIKSKKRWTESASAGKPIKVSTSGVLDGDKLTVMSIN